MDWIMLQKTMPDATDYDDAARVKRLSALMAVLNNRQYDHIPFAFSEEREQEGRGSYIPLDKRRPSARTGLCRIVVEDAASLLFSEGHWPICDVPAATQTRPGAEPTEPAEPAAKPPNRAKDAIADIVKTCLLNHTMITAATRGSVGSILLFVRTVNGRPFVKVMDTRYLTPEFDNDAPNTLVKVTEKYKIKAKALRSLGYDIAKDEADDKEYWFQRTWDIAEELWYVPWPVKNIDGKEVVPQIDRAKTPLPHYLGYVPMIWIKNLPGLDDDDPDGACTFENAIDTVIEADYLISQAGRGLKYASDPKLAIMADIDEKKTTGGSAEALIIGTDGDAKMLEINGTAATAVGEHTDTLRRMALEIMHGNRSDPDKLSSAQSGRAMELLHLGLIWLADRMRITYGEGGLLTLYRMLCQMSCDLDTGLVIGHNTYRKLDGSGLVLKWPSWFAPTFGDKTEMASALVSLITAQVLSKQTATQEIASTYNIEDIEAERLLIDAEAQAQDAREIAIAAAVQVKETTSA